MDAARSLKVSFDAAITTQSSVVPVARALKMELASTLPSACHVGVAMDRRNSNGSTGWLAHAIAGTARTDVGSGSDQGCSRCDVNADLVIAVCRYSSVAGKL